MTKFAKRNPVATIDAIAMPLVTLTKYKHHQIVRALFSIDDLIYLKE